MKRLKISAIALMLATGAAHSAVVHDEAAQGDLIDVMPNAAVASTLLFDLTTISSVTVNGTLEAGSPANVGPDKKDFILFRTNGDFTVNLSVSSGTVFVGLNDLSRPAGSKFVGGGAAGTDVLSKLGPQIAGTYALALNPRQGIGSHEYSVTITGRDGASIFQSSAQAFDASVPLPASLPLLALGLVGVGALFRRKKAS